MSCRAILGIFIILSVFVWGAGGVVTAETVQEIDLGTILYTQAPKTWTVDIPSTFTKVETGHYGVGESATNKYGGWNGYLKVNGEYVWKFLHYDGVGHIMDYALGQEVLETTGRNQYLDATSFFHEGSNTITYYHYTAGDGIGVRLKVYSTEAGPSCNDGTCDSGEDCSSCPSDCGCTSTQCCSPDSSNAGWMGCVYSGDATTSGKICCSGSEYSGDCCDDAYCSSSYECVSHQCVISGPVCGDSICSSGETCTSDECCSGVSVDFDTDENNCGSCSNACSSGYECQYGSCVSAGPEVSTVDYPTGLAWDGSNLWVITKADWTNYVCKLSSNLAVQSCIKLPFTSDHTNPRGVTYDGTYFWVSYIENCASILKIDTSGNVVSSIQPAYCLTNGWGLAWDGSYLWAADLYHDKIYKLNPNTGSVVTSFASPENPNDIAWGGSYLWVAAGHKIYKLDTSGNVITSFYPSSYYPAGLTWDGSNLWVSDDNTDEIYKITEFCGNDYCGSGEDCSSCSADCGCSSGYVCQSGSCVSAGPVCGDDVCDSTESYSTCPSDCPAPSDCGSTNGVAPTTISVGQTYSCQETTTSGRYYKFYLSESAKVKVTLADSIGETALYMCKGSECSFGSAVFAQGDHTSGEDEVITVDLSAGYYSLITFGSCLKSKPCPYTLKVEKVTAALNANGESCSYSSECSSSNCKNGVCCAYGKTCCKYNTHCSTDYECGSSSYCVKKTALKANGESCSASSECSSSNCKNGVCCTSGKTCCKYDSGCYSALGSGYECGSSSYCVKKAAKKANGGSCSYDSECESNWCSNNVCCPYLKVCCKDNSPCGGNYECGADNYCVEKEEEPKKKNGESCSYSTECSSGNCRNGVCCLYGKSCCTRDSHCYSGYECGSSGYCVKKAVVEGRPKFSFRIEPSTWYLEEDEEEWVSISVRNTGTADGTIDLSIMPIPPLVVQIGGQPTNLILNDIYVPSDGREHYAGFEIKAREGGTSKVTISGTSLEEEGFPNVFKKDVSVEVKKAVCGNGLCEEGETCENCGDCKVEGMCCAPDKLYAKASAQNYWDFTPTSDSGGNVPYGYMVAPEELTEGNRIRNIVWDPEVCCGGNLLAGECCSNGDCGSGEMCKNNRCEEVECSKDDDCGLNSVCENGACVDARMTILFVPVNWDGDLRKRDEIDIYKQSVGVVGDEIKRIYGELECNPKIRILTSYDDCKISKFECTSKDIKKIRQCAKKSGNYYRKADYVVGLEDSDVCGATSGFSVLPDTVIFAEYASPDDSHIAAHELGHIFNLVDEYCWIDWPDAPEAGPGEMSFTNLCGPNAWPNYLDAEFGCDPEGGCCRAECSGEVSSWNEFKSHYVACCEGNEYTTPDGRKGKSLMAASGSSLPYGLSEPSRDWLNAIMCGGQ